MPRANPEWIGKTPDTKVPAHVRLRIFRAHEGRCHITGRKITPADEWELDHVLALINGGEHRESNLAPALRSAHRSKTADDVKAKAKSDRIAKRHIGIKKPATLQSRGFAKSGPQRKASTPIEPKFAGDVLARRSW